MAFSNWFLEMGTDCHGHLYCGAGFHLKRSHAGVLVYRVPEWEACPVCTQPLRGCWPKRHCRGTLGPTATNNPKPYDLKHSSNKGRHPGAWAESSHRTLLSWNFSYFWAQGHTCTESWMWVADHSCTLVWPSRFTAFQVCTCVYTCMHACVSHMCVCEQLICVNVDVCECTCMSMHMIICIHTLLCLCACVCVCSCVHFVGPGRAASAFFVTVPKRISLLVPTMGKQHSSWGAATWSTHSWHSQPRSSSMGGMEAVGADSWESLSTRYRQWFLSVLLWCLLQMMYESPYLPFPSKPSP